MSMYVLHIQFMLVVHISHYTVHPEGIKTFDGGIY